MVVLPRYSRGEGEAVIFWSLYTQVYIILSLACCPCGSYPGSLIRVENEHGGEEVECWDTHTLYTSQTRCKLPKSGAFPGGPVEGPAVADALAPSCEHL